MYTQTQSWADIDSVRNNTSVNWARKTDFDEIDEFERDPRGYHIHATRLVNLNGRVLRFLTTLDIIEVESIWDELPQKYEEDIIFIATWRGRKFLVNTEGYNYCRYITELV